MFFDRARIWVQGGQGGDGIVAFLRQKHAPRGGPSGGNGGRGGHVVAVADESMNTLHGLRRKVHYRAGKGGRGGNTTKQGAYGADLEVRVPTGTLVRDAEDGNLMADLTDEGQRALLVRGGRGGRGNASFRSARHQAPRLAEKGEPGQECWLDLEMKLVAEVGIIGVPNAGKSTLISRISAARPEIADYPFTTLVPNLGVVELDHRQRIFVDIPGLVEGAHQGTGLGIEFLRHVERTRLLVHLLDGSSDDPGGEMAMIEAELASYSEALAAKPRVVVLNKWDLPQARAAESELRTAMETRGLPFWSISAATGENVQDLIWALDRRLETIPAVEASTRPDLPEIAVSEDDRAFTVTRLGPDRWQVAGVGLERITRMTNWELPESALRFQNVLDTWGVSDTLRTQGVEEGDTVRIAESELVWGFDNAF